MYTGIVDHLGILTAITAIENGLKFTVTTNFNDFQMGESIAINGVCVTVTRFGEHDFDCELSPETLKLTNLGTLTQGAKVNLERSLKLSDRLGGHFVMGHVDTTLKVKQIEPAADFTCMSFSGITAENRAFFVKKGSVCINGVSLTINEIFPDGFSVMLIPHTKAQTNLQFLNIGDFVNIEYDTIARVVVHQLQLTQTEV